MIDCLTQVSGRILLPYLSGIARRRDVSAARNSNVLSAGDAMTSTTSAATSASGSPAASVIAQSVPATASADTEPGAAMDDNVDTTVLYHNGASGSVSTV